MFASTVNPLVSTDVVVEASATLIAGMIFLVSIRQALKLPDLAFYGKMVAIGIVIFIFAILVAIVEDMIPSEYAWPKIVTWLVFFTGLLWLAQLVWRMPRQK